MPLPLYQKVPLSPEKVLEKGESPQARGKIRGDRPVLLLLAAGKGTRFGAEPKCVAPVGGIPLARHSLNAFESVNPGAATVCVVGHLWETVTAALGSDPVYILSENPTGGTAWAVYEAFALPELIQWNPIVVISMGDRVVPPEIFRRLLAIHAGRENGAEAQVTGGQSPVPTGHEADLTLLTAQYSPETIHGKGRIVRNRRKEIIRIVEERDILSLQSDSSKTEKRIAADPSSTASLGDLTSEFPESERNLVQGAFLSLTEGNCPLYALRAETLYRHLMLLSDNNAQRQYYLTDIIERIAESGGTIRSMTVRSSDPEFDVLCADVTRRDDIPRLEAALRRNSVEDEEIRLVAEAIRRDRPAGQTASIRRQLRELEEAVEKKRLGFDSDAPFSIGISGGRFRVAFMHPDMGRFFGPAWQVPIGAREESGTEQIVLFLQETDDRRLHLFPLAEQFRESIDSIATDREEMYPDSTVSDWYSYEEFGTRMSRRLLLSLGYFSDSELARRRSEGIPLPPETLWVASNMRRPFSLIGNVLASLRTYRKGEKGKRIAARLGKENFRGLRMASTGLIPQGGFSCSSALTIAVKNAINALYRFDLTGDELIHLAAQAEYGTGVRAGSLDQATVQKGRAGAGTLISSNPKDNYAVLGQFPIPGERFAVLFPYTAPRDSDAWRYSAGFYAAGSDDQEKGVPTTTETRKMTGKAAEIAALLLRQPLDIDLFDEIRDDLLDDGLLSVETRRMIAEKLRTIPLLISKEELRRKTEEAIPFYVSELVRCRGLSAEEARRSAVETVASLFQGWREPIFKTPDDSLRGDSGRAGVPLRAMVAYLYGETAKNFYLIHHPEEWISRVAISQRGDCCFEIDPGRLPERAELETLRPEETTLSGPERVVYWLEAAGARPFDFNRGLDDAALSAPTPQEFYRLSGSNFFRGLALIDLAEAFLWRAFGYEAVAVRVNAAGQGDFFQVHIDTRLADPADVKRFLSRAWYRRFGIVTENEFIEIYPGGAAVGVTLSRFALLGRLIEALK